MDPRAAIYDPYSLVALQAFRDEAREEHRTIVGDNASSEAGSELMNKGTRFTGSVGCFPECHGEGVIPRALDILVSLFLMPHPVDTRWPHSPACARATFRINWLIHWLLRRLP